MGKSRRTGGSFGSTPSGSQRSREDQMRDTYGTDRHPTAEDFIKAVEENPEVYDPGEIGTGPNNLRSSENRGGRGVGGHNLASNGKSNWLADNPIDIDVDVDPGALSTSVGLYDDGTNSVRGVVGVDLVPMGVDINVNGDVGSIGLELGAPGDMFGVNVEVSVDVTTGEIIGGGVGLEGGGLAVTVNQTSHKGKTCTSITVTYFGVGASYQNCKRDDEDEPPPKEPPPKEPPPGPGSEIPPPLPPPPTTQIPGDQNRYCIAFCFQHLIYYRQVQLTGTGDCAGLAENANQTTSGSTNISSSGVSYTFTNLYTNPIDPRYDKNENYAGAGYVTRLSDGRISWKLTSGGGGGNLYMFEGSVRDINTILAKYTYYPQVVSEDSLWQFSSCPHKIYSGASMWLTPSVYFPDNGDIWKPGDEKPAPPPKPEPPIPPIPPEDDVTECCNLEPVMSMLRKLNQALAVDEVIGAGLDLPNEWILPTGTGHTRMQNYLQIAVFLAKMQDHLGVHPLTVQIADLSAGQEGNQEFKKYYPNGTKAIQEILTILHDENSDSADRLNLQMRLAVLNTRIFLTVASISRSVRGIFQFLGIPIREKREAVPLPFDFTFGLRKGKGFSQDAKKDGEELERNMAKLQEQLNKNTENATEALLAKFLADSDQPIGYETFDANHPDFLSLLKNLTSFEKSK